MHRLLVHPLVLALPFLFAASLAAQVSVTGLTSLGTLGGSTSMATAINDSGTITGIAANPAGHSRAFTYSGGTMTDLGTLGGNTSAGYAINATGQVAGNASAPGGSYAMWHNGSVMSSLPDLGINATAYGINASGWLTGETSAFGDTRAFVATTSSFTILGSLGGTYTVGYGINQAGHVAGGSLDASGNERPFLHDGTTMHDLGTFGGTYGHAHAINASGMVVGWTSVTGDEYYRAFVHDGTTLTNLGSLGTRESMAYDINDLGQIVGFAQTAESTYVPFLYVDGTMHNLADLAAGFMSDGSTPGFVSFVQMDFMEINNAGQIVGTGEYFDGTTTALRGYVMSVEISAVPEPSTYALLTGGAALGLAAWRRRQATRPA